MLAHLREGIHAREHLRSRAQSVFAGAETERGVCAGVGGAEQGRDRREKEGSMSGTGLIAQERERQIAVEGWTPEHDDAHDDGSISSAACAYTMIACEQIYPEQVRSFEEMSKDALAKAWAWDEEWWKPSIDPIRNLTKAGALIAAEIDRLQRNQIKQATR